MNQKETILSEIEKRGGQITTWELLNLHIAQYQTRLKELRERGIPISEGEAIEGQKGNFLYRLAKNQIRSTPDRVRVLRKPPFAGTQGDLIKFETTQHGYALPG